MHIRVLLSTTLLYFNNSYRNILVFFFLQIARRENMIPEPGNDIMLYKTFYNT